MWTVATLALIAGMIDDLRSRKVHNILIVALFAVTLIANFYFRGVSGSMVGLQASGLAMLLMLPMFMTGILGGGDVKLFMVFAFAVDPSSAFWTFIYSIVWGALFGLSRAALQKDLAVLVRNTYKLGTRQKVQPQQLHKIPYTFALLLGWFTQLTLLRAGGLL